MKSRRRFATYALFGLATVLVALAATAMPHRTSSPARVPLTPPPPPPPLALVQPPPAPPAPPPAPAEPPKVDVVFALDTTGSMDGLLEGAKRKIWSIATYISQAQPKPTVRIGLVGYRDLGDAYVTRFYDLSEDFDTVFKHLSSFRADGGGDTPEHVARALHEAVNRASWSSGDRVVKLVYVVGDAPPHNDYRDGFNYRAIARQAAARGIKVNTILCGGDGDARVAWREIARLGSGEYAAVSQSGGMARVATPYDDKLTELNRRLAGTALGWGSAGRRREVAAKASFAAAAPADVAVERANYAARNKIAVSGDGELLNDLASGKANLGAIDRQDLPEPMQGMAPAAQAAFVAEKKVQREQVLKEMDDLTTKRDAYLKAKPARSAGPSFDEEVRKSVTKAASPYLAF